MGLDGPCSSASEVCGCGPNGGRVLESWSQTVVQNFQEPCCGKGGSSWMHDEEEACLETGRGWMGWWDGYGRR